MTLKFIYIYIYFKLTAILPNGWMAVADIEIDVTLGFRNSNICVCFILPLNTSYDNILVKGRNVLLSDVRRVYRVCLSG